MKHVFQATTDKDIEAARTLFNEYAAGLGISLCFQNFDQELAALPGAYSPPMGCLLLAEMDGRALGCVALRPLSTAVCEMKRLYVDPGHRGSGAGLTLIRAVMDRARALGYTAMRLDTLPTMAKAIKLYGSLGFQQIEPYYSNPVPGALFFECKL